MRARWIWSRTNWAWTRSSCVQAKNFMHDGDIDPTGEEYQHIRGDEAFNKAMEIPATEAQAEKCRARGCLCNGRPRGGEGNVDSLDEEDGGRRFLQPMADQGAGVLTVIMRDRRGRAQDAS